MTTTYVLLATILIAGACIACFQRIHKNTLPQEILLDKLSEKDHDRR